MTGVGSWWRAVSALRKRTVLFATLRVATRPGAPNRWPRSQIGRLTRSTADDRVSFPGARLSGRAPGFYVRPRFLAASHLASWAPDSNSKDPIAPERAEVPSCA